MKKILNLLIAVFMTQLVFTAYGKYSDFGDEDGSKQWFQYVLKKQNGIVVNSGESVMIVEIEGECVKVLFRDSEWWTLARILKMK